VVRFERTFPHSAAAVWAAVTEPQQLEEWFPTTVQFDSLAEGAPIEFHFPGDAFAPMTGEFLDVDAPRRLAFTWGEDRLTFELAERHDGAACRLSFTVVLGAEDKAARDSAGWESCLDMLAQVAARDVSQRPAPNESWQAYYEEYKRLGLPATAEIPRMADGLAG
jgi:uncharacterized protein YndB with AHSA1/START domain